MNINETDHLLATTRAVRKRLDLERPVEREVILECLRLAVQAPTGGNRQSWRFIVVTDPAKRAALAELYRRPAAILARSKAVAEEQGEVQTARVYDSAMYLADVFEKVPVHLIACAEGKVENMGNTMAAAYYGSILPAVWSFMLAARSRGLGTVWTTLHLVSEKEAAELLGIPETWTQVALIPVGYIKGGDLKPAVRPPVEEVTYFDTWGAH